MTKDLKQKKLLENEKVPEGLLEYHKNLIQHKKLILRLKKSVINDNTKITKCLICENVLEENDSDGICEDCRKSFFPKKQEKNKLKS